MARLVDLYMNNLRIGFIVVPNGIQLSRRDIHYVQPKRWNCRLLDSSVPGNNGCLLARREAIHEFDDYR